MVEPGVASVMTTLGKLLVMTPPAGFSAGVAVVWAEGDVCCGELPLPPPLPPPQPISEQRVTVSTRDRATENVARVDAMGANALCRTIKNMRIAQKRLIQIADNGGTGRAGGELGALGTRGMLEAAVVVTVTTKGVGAPLAKEMLVGTVQVATKGTPVQVKVNVPLKPAAGVAWRLNCAVWPADIEADVEPPAAALSPAADPPVP